MKFRLLLIIILALVFTGKVSAEEATPSATPAGSPAVITSPTPKPIPTPAATPATSTSPAPSPETAGTGGDGESTKSAVLGSATVLGSTSAGRDLVKWIFAGSLGIVVMLVGVKLARESYDEGE